MSRDGEKFFSATKEGFYVTPLQSKGKSAKTGTMITFYPDPEIFEEINFDFQILNQRLRKWHFK